MVIVVDANLVVAAAAAAALTLVVGTVAADIFVSGALGLTLLDWVVCLPLQVHYSLVDDYVSPVLSIVSVLLVQ